MVDYILSKNDYFCHFLLFDQNHQKSLKMGNFDHFRHIPIFDPKLAPKLTPNFGGKFRVKTNPRNYTRF